MTSKMLPGHSQRLRAFSERASNSAFQLGSLFFVISAVQWTAWSYRSVSGLGVHKMRNLSFYIAHHIGGSNTPVHYSLFFYPSLPPSLPLTSAGAAVPAGGVHPVHRALHLRRALRHPQLQAAGACACNQPSDVSG